MWAGPASSKQSTHYGDTTPLPISLFPFSHPPPRLPSLDHRGRVICELIETERRYISQLEVILGLYLPSLVGVVSPKDLRVLLPDQLEPLLEAHKDLLSRLEERSMPGNAFYGIVGDLFGRLCALNSVSLMINNIPPLLCRLLGEV